MIKNEDLYKIRRGDLPYVEEVVQYLKERGLDVSLEGSAVIGDQRYEDIDLLATGSLNDVAVTVHGLNRRAEERVCFPRQATNGREYHVKHEGGPHHYVGTRVDEEFKIKVCEAGKVVVDTEIDVCLKVLAGLDEPWRNKQNDR